MVLLYTITIFISATLLLLVQPMFTRMVLPLLGGSPAVWNTSLVFFQASLLAGYAYAHFTTRWLGVRRQRLLHVAVLLLPLLVLPIGIPVNWTPSPSNPIPSLLALVGLTVALPFFAVSATSPLLQRWFGAAGHPRSQDPYFLYSASNLGSLLAVACYPVLIEPRLGLLQQSRWWAWGYGALLILMVICCVLAGRNPAPTKSIPAVPIAWNRRGRWLLLAFVPCSLMLSVTAYMTNEVASVPLLWLLPLGIYLLTFVLVFARRQRLPHKWMVRMMPVAVLALPWTMSGMLLGQPTEPLDCVLGLHLAAMFVVAMVCHGELAKDRPSPEQLTEFFLWLSLGGVLGGVFNALLAPQIFPTVIEYPLTLVLACALMPGDRRLQIGDLVWPILLGLAVLGLGKIQFHNWWLWLAVACVIPSVTALFFFRRPIRFALVIAALLVAITLPPWLQSTTLCLRRSFFGINRVYTVGNFHWLKHGSTIHGIQDYDPAHRLEALTYYSQSGPLGQTLAVAPPELKQHVGAIGLGAGTIASYGDHNEQWTFFEIDPVVDNIARDPRYFRYLQDSAAKVKVVLGDARLSLQQVPDGHFGILVLDAYNSDAPPLHLLTREALALYRRKLAPDGVLLFNISTRHLDLTSVLANLAQDDGWLALTRHDIASRRDLARYISSSRWMVLTRNQSLITSLTSLGYWRTPKPAPSVGIWTDDYVSLFRVWSWY